MEIDEDACRGTGGDRGDGGERVPGILIGQVDAGRVVAAHVPRRHPVGAEGGADDLVGLDTDLLRRVERGSIVGPERQGASAPPCRPTPSPTQAAPDRRPTTRRLRAVRAADGPSFDVERPCRSTCGWPTG